MGMFLVTETDADAIRAIFDEHGELSAAIELRRRFPGIIDNENARACARSIASWTPLPVPAPKVDTATAQRAARGCPPKLTPRRGDR